LILLQGIVLLFDCLQQVRDGLLPFLVVVDGAHINYILLQIKEYSIQKLILK